MNKMSLLLCSGLFLPVGCHRSDAEGGDAAATETIGSGTTSNGGTESTHGSTTGTGTNTAETSETGTGTTTTTETTSESGTDTMDVSTDTTDDGNIEYCAMLDDWQSCAADDLCYEVIACKVEWLNEPYTWCCNENVFLGCQSKQQKNCGDNWFCKDGDHYLVSDYACVPADTGFVQCFTPPGMKDPDAC